MTIYKNNHFDLDNIDSLSSNELKLLLNDLQVHQIELELQKEELEKTQKKLVEVNKQYTNLFNQSPSGFIVLDPHGIILKVNQTFCNMLDKNERELLNKPLNHFIYNKDIQHFLARFKAFYKIPENKSIQIRFVKNGDPFYVNIEGKFIKDDLDAKSNFDTHVLLTIHDVDNEQKFQEQIRLQSRMLNSVGQAIIATDTKGKIFYWNQFAEEMYGWEQNEVLGRDISDITPSDISKDDAKDIMAKLVQGQKWNGQFRAKHKTGKEIIAYVIDTPVFDESGNLAGIIGISEDITEKVYQEERIKHLNSVLKAIRNVNQLITHERNISKLIKQASNLLIETRGYYNIFTILLDSLNNIEHLEIADFNNIEIIKKQFHKKLPPCAEAALEKSGIHIMKNPEQNCSSCPVFQQYKNSGRYVVRLEHNNKIFGVLAVSIPLKFIDDLEEKELFVEVANDVAMALYLIEKEKKEEIFKKELIESQNKLATTLSSITDGFISVDESFKIIYFNKAAEKLLGRQASQLLGQSLFEAFPEAKDSVFEENYTKAFTTQKPCEFETFFDKKPYRNWYNVKAYPHPKGLSIYFLVTTEKKKMYKELEISKKELSLFNKITLQFVNELDDRVYSTILEILLHEFSSKYGYFGYINENGDLVCPSMTRDVWDQCQISDKSIVFPRDKWGGLWGKSLTQKKAFLLNKGLSFPAGHVQLENVMVCPIIFNEKLIGQFAIANNKNNYTRQDLELLKKVSEYIAPILNSKFLEAREHQLLLEANNKIAKWANIFENAEWGIVIGSNDGQFYELMNPAFVKMHGYSIEELSGKPVSFLFSPQERKSLEKHIQTVNKQGYHTFESVHIRKDGTTFPVLINITLVRDIKNNVQYRVVNVQDISRLKKIEDDLIKAKESAEAANKAKGEFLANMSHELRTPLNGIMGMTELLSTSRLDSREKHFLAMLKFSAERLFEIIENLLDFEKLDSNKLKIENEKFNITELFENIIIMFKPVAYEKGLNLILEIAPDVQYFYGDKTRIGQILVNLLSNAIKFTEEGKIIVKLEIENDLILNISDMGIGIEKEQINKIFDSFLQIEKTYTKSHPGLGLGLSITQSLIKMMNGQIKVNSTPGVGTTFTVIIPVLVHDFNDVKKEISKQHRISIKDFDIKNVLVVEDEVINRLFITTLLGKYNWKIDEAGNGLEAIELVEKYKYDLILMDIGLPELNGIDTTRLIRANQLNLNQKTPIISLTAHAYPDDVQQCYDAGMNYFIAKPIDEQKITTAISKVFQET